MKAELSRRCVVAIAIFSLFLLIVDCGDAASPTQARIIDRNGIHIPSIFHGISPNPRFAVEYQRTLKGKGRNPGSCFVLQASYHYNRGTGQLLNVQGTPVAPIIRCLSSETVVRSAVVAKKTGLIATHCSPLTATDMRLTI